MPPEFRRSRPFFRLVFPVVGQYSIEALENRTLLSVSALLDSSLAHTNVEVAPISIGSGDETSAGTATPTGTTPTQMRHAYGVDSISLSTPSGIIPADGRGQTIGIVDAYDDPAIVSSSAANYSTSDLANFISAYNLQPFGVSGGPTFTKVSQTGSTTNLPNQQPSNSTSDWPLEIALDVEWAHVIAPMANIVLVEANDNSSFLGVSNLQTAVKYAASHGCSVVSMSWGGGESSGKVSRDSDFLQPGVTYFSSTGDAGQPGNYPAFSPNVVAVGGTSLFLNGNNYSSESAWAGSGGGISQFETMPAYQSSITNISNNGMRMIPDISFDADPNTGVPIYNTMDGNPTTPWEQIGGTSLSSPCWAGLMAIADEGSVANGHGTLSGATTLNDLYKVSRNSYHDVTTGGNNLSSAGPGYDLVTGIGTPITNILIPELANPSPTPSTPTEALSAASDTGTSNSDRITNINTPIFTGHTSAYANINLFIGSTLVGQGSSDASGNYSVTSSVQTDGTYSYTVNASDISGTSGTSTSVSVTIDTTAPTLINPGNQTFEMVTTQLTTVNFNQVTTNDPAHPTIVSNKTSPSQFSPGNTIITSSATDVAGNTSTTSFTISLVDPVFLTRGAGAVYAFVGQTLQIVGGAVTFIADAGTTKPGLSVSLSGTTVLTVNATQHLNNLTLSTSTINGTGDINLAGSMSWSGGTMSGSGKTIISSGAVLNMSGIAAKNLSRELDNNGTANWTGGDIKFNGGTFDNNVSSTFNASVVYDGVNNGLLSNAGGTNAFNNFGYYHQTDPSSSGGIASDVRVPFSDAITGFVTTDAGCTTHFYGGGSYSGSLFANGLIGIENPMTFTSNSAASGTGKFVIDASLAFAGTISSLTELDFNSAVTTSFANLVSMDSAAGLIKAINAASVTFTGGATTHALQARGDSNLTFNSNLSAATVLVTDAGSHIGLNGALSALPALEIDTGASASLGSGGGKVLRFGQLTMNGTATIDLADNAMIYDATGPAALSFIQALINSGFHGGDWLGTGFQSTIAAGVAANGSNFNKTSIGFADSAKSANPSSFAGQQLTAPAILIGYTFNGDTDLDGTVNSADFDHLAASFGQSALSWADGDFNFNTIVNALDFNALASNYGSPSSSQLAASDSSAATPLSTNASATNSSAQKTSLFNDDNPIESVADELLTV